MKGNFRASLWLMKCSFRSWRMKPTSFEFWCVFSWENSCATHESLEMEIPYQSFKFSLLSWEMDLLENTCKRDNGRKSAMLEAQEVKQARAPHSTENFLSYRTSSHQILSHPVKVSFIGQLWRPTPSSKAIWTWFYEIWHKIISLDLSCYFDPKIQHNLYCSATTDLIHFLRWFESIEN